MYLSIFLDFPFCFPVLFIHVLITSCFNNRAFLAILVYLSKCTLLSTCLASPKQKLRWYFYWDCILFIDFRRNEPPPGTPSAVASICSKQLSASSGFLSLALESPSQFQHQCQCCSPALTSIRALTTLPYPCYSFCNLFVGLLLPTCLWHSFSLYCLSQHSCLRQFQSQLMASVTCRSVPLA